ncbi:MAG: hypothetical protein KDB07_08710 [Planctomycetes bacterium]|nr:hypothetical protein [Planctomycetota bacterium]
MGYSTDFTGHFEITPPLDTVQAEYLQKFSETRRMRRDNALLVDYREPKRQPNRVEDPLRQAVNLPTGVEGGYFVGGQGFAGQTKDMSVLDYNHPPQGQPGLWCDWTVSEDGKQLRWNGSEKTYKYVQWLQYLIDNFFELWGRKLSGDVQWQGESSTDMGVISIKDNIITVRKD